MPRKGRRNGTATASLTEEPKSGVGWIGQLWTDELSRAALRRCRPNADNADTRRQPCTPSRVQNGVTPLRRHPYTPAHSELVRNPSFGTTPNLVAENPALRPIAGHLPLQPSETHFFSATGGAEASSVAFRLDGCYLSGRREIRTRASIPGKSVRLVVRRGRQVRLCPDRLRAGGPLRLLGPKEASSWADSSTAKWPWSPAETRA